MADMLEVYNENNGSFGNKWTDFNLLVQIILSTTVMSSKRQQIIIIMARDIVNEEGNKEINVEAYDTNWN